MICALQIQAQDVYYYVNPLIGTAPASTPGALRNSSTGSEEKGQTVPFVGRPFGMTQWTAETRTSEQKCIAPYYYNDKSITGFRGSHWMNGSCTQDYGSLSLMPFTTDSPDSVVKSPVSSFRHETEISAPAYYSVMLDDYGLKTEMTGTERCGCLRFTYSGNKYNCISLRVNSDFNQGVIFQYKKIIIASNPVHRIYQGRGENAGFAGWFVILFDKEYNIMKTSPGKQELILSFGDEPVVCAYIGTSFTGKVAAMNNLAAEIPGLNFDLIRKISEEEWKKALGQIEVKGNNQEDKIKFYTALYHCYQLPRIVSDADGSYQAFAEDTCTCNTGGFDYYDDFSMWDTYRALHPLMTIIEPARSLDMVKSLVLKARQGKWMPIFPAWGNYTAAMIGDHASTMIADAIVKGINGFDTDTAYKYMRKNAFIPAPKDDYLKGKGRRALVSYLRYGYIPLEDSVWDAFHKREQVSRTLEYAFDDYALARVAQIRGSKSDYRILMQRSKNYRNVIDPLTTYARGRYADGRWYSPFDPNQRVFYICEGTPFQYTWYVPQDIPGLEKLMGGKEAFLKKLDEFFEGGYYWHGNETDQQAPFLYSMAGNLEKTAIRTHIINKEEYGTGPGGLSGNEDAGQMSAWLVFSMMGFYPACPASGRYILTTPEFDEVTIHLSSERTFTIKAEGRNEDTLTHISAKLNGSPVRGNSLSHMDLIKGGELTYTFSR